MKRIMTSLMVTGLAAAPAMAAPGQQFISLANTDFVKILGFLVFLGVIFYFRVPSLLGRLIDKRADGIRADLDEARALREEAQTILAGYERKKAEVEELAQKIVDRARIEAEEAAEAARAALEASIERRLKAAGDQIASAEAAAVREVRDRAIEVAVAVAAKVVAGSMTAAEADAMIENSIAEVRDRLH